MTTRMYPRGRAPRRQDTERIVVQLRPPEVVIANQYAVDVGCSRSTFVRNMYLIGLDEYQKRPTKTQLIDVVPHQHAVAIAEE